MKTIKEKPSSSQIERLFKDRHEALYLDGVGDLCRNEVSRYHNKIIAENLKDYNFVTVIDRDKSPAGIAVFRDSRWDTEFLNQNIAKLDYLITKDKASNREDIYSMLLKGVFQACRQTGIKLIFYRDSIKNKALNRFISSTGTSPISVMVNLYRTFDKKGNKDNLKEPDIRIRRAALIEHSKIEEIASKGFKNRLLNEPLFKKSDVKNLYREWARNDLRGRVKKVLVAEIDRCIAGFVAFDTLDISNKNFGFIDLIVVGKGFRQRGVGTALMTEIAVRLHKGFDGILVGTERENAEALRFYSNLGFRIIDSHYSYHIRLD